MANWNNPTGSSTFSDFLSWMRALAIDAATFFVSSPTNQPTGAMKYDRATDKFQEWDGSAWVDQIISIAGGGTGGATPSDARTNLELGDLAVLDTIGNSEITDVDLSKVTGAGTLASLDNVGDFEISSVSFGKVTGIGTLAELNSITDANISSPVGLAKGGTGATDASGARGNLGLGSMATQNSGAVSITGGSVVAPNVADTGNNTNITGMLNLTGRLGAHVTIRGDAITGLTPAGMNLGDSTYDINGLRVRAIAPISGQSVKIYTTFQILDGVTLNIDPVYLVHTFRPINHNSVALGIPGTEWANIYSVTAVTVSSDIRLKSKIQDLENCLETICKLKPKRYEKYGKTELGLIAQAVEGVVPEAVSKGDLNEELTPDGKPWGIQYEMLIPLLIGAIKELEEEVKKLKDLK
jgi:hypothetical protein